MNDKSWPYMVPVDKSQYTGEKGSLEHTLDGRKAEKMGETTERF
jgi:hypothetical protein